MTEIATPPAGRTPRILRHPATITALLGVVVAALNIWWVHSQRHLGAYNVDEVGYMATALRFHRSLDLAHPLEFLKTIGAPSSTGPLVPLLAVPLIVVFGRGVPVVMLIQPLLVVVAAVAVAGITSVAAGRRAGVVAGFVTLCVPGMVQAARGFQYATAAAAFLGLAVWALLASDRGRRRPQMLAFGAATGLMLLSRTMAVGFLPGLAVAAAIQARRDRHAWANVGLAAAVATVVAGPWWVASRDALFDYLFGFGFGRSSQFYGDSAPWDRVMRRWSNLAEDVRVLRWVGAAVILAAAGTAIVHLIAARRSDRITNASGTIVLRRAARRALDDPLSTIGTVVAVGYLMLLTTRNQGVWFELPLETLMVAFIVAVAARLAPPLRTTLELAAVAVAMLTFAVSLTDPGGLVGRDPSQRSSLQRVQLVLYGALIDKERPLSDADPALGSDDPAVRDRAAQRWWDANVAVAEAIEHVRAATGNRLFISVSGNSHLINGQSLLLTGELQSLPTPPSEVPDTSASASELRRHLTPTFDGLQRMLVLITSRSQPFPEDREVPRLETLATSLGWRPSTRIPLPDGGEVLFMTRPGR